MFDEGKRKFELIADNSKENLKSDWRFGKRRITKNKNYSISRLKSGTTLTPSPESNGIPLTWKKKKDVIFELSNRHRSMIDELMCVRKKMTKLNYVLRLENW